MTMDPWKDPDPQPGDFDAELDQAEVEIHDGSPETELPILASRATEMRPCCVTPTPMEAMGPSG